MNDVELKNWLRNELFERAPTNIAIIDQEFRIVEANGKFSREFGQWQNRLCYEVFKDRDEPCANCQAKLTFNDGKSRVGEVKRKNSTGRDGHYVVHLEAIKDRSEEIPYIIEMSRDVTEERDIRDEHDILFDRVPCYVVVLDRNMKIVRANELFRKKFGEATGELCHSMFKKQDQRCEACPARKTFHDGQVHTSHQQGEDKNGRPVYYMVTTAPLGRTGEEPTHVIEMALDVTETRALEEKLKQSFDFQENLINSAIDGIIAADEEGMITIANPSAEDLFKIKSREVVGKTGFDLYVPKAFVDVIAEGNGSYIAPEITVHDREGEAIPVRFSGSVLKSDDKYLGAAGFFQDLREMKKLEHEKLEVERLAAVGQTVAGLAHGIKNVLTGLEGGMYVVNSGMKKDDKELTKRGWDMLQNNIERITTYVKDFLNFAKGKKARVSIVDPLLVAEEVFNLYKDIAANIGVTLLFEPDDGIESDVFDHEGLHSCLANLVSNAIDACEMSENEKCNVVLRVFERDATIIFEVQDDGCGMDYEVKQKVFTTFFSTKGSTKGTGLGLLVTRRITQEHGGKIELDSQEGKGSVFRLVFPRSRLPELTTPEM
jgi:PAS domain S-box-containing protein